MITTSGSDKTSDESVAAMPKLPVLVDTNAQWEYIKPMLPKPAKRGRPRTDLRQVLDAIFYVLKGGIQWRYLPAGFP